MSNLCVARDSSHKVKQRCTETNEDLNCTPRSSGSYPGLETSGNSTYTLGFKELWWLQTAPSLLVAASSPGLEVALREARARSARGSGRKLHI